MPHAIARNADRRTLERLAEIGKMRVKPMKVDGTKTWKTFGQENQKDDRLGNQEYVRPGNQEDVRPGKSGRRRAWKIRPRQKCGVMCRRHDVPIARRFIAGYCVRQPIRVPEGRDENSPELQLRVPAKTISSPVGTNEGLSWGNGRPRPFSRCVASSIDTRTHRGGAVVTPIPSNSIAGFEFNLRVPKNAPRVPHTVTIPVIT